MPVIEDVIKNKRNKKILLFGTPKGDTKEDLDYLDDKYSHVCLSENFRVRDFDDVLQDSMMMSCCASLIAYEHTGVVRLARLFNPDLNLESFNEIYTKEEFFQLCLDNVENQEYNPIQRSYISVRALALCEDLGIPEEIRTFLMLNIRMLDPQNELLWLN